MNVPSTENTYLVSGMDCASCAQKIATGVERLDGVQSCTLTFTTGKLHVLGDVPRADVVRRVEDLGYEVLDPESGTSSHSNDTAEPTGFLAYMWRRTETRLAMLGLLFVLPGLIFHELMPGLEIHHVLIDILAIAAMLVAGYPVFQNAWRSLKINRDLDMNVLMSIAAIGAVLIGAYVEAAMVMVLFSLGELLEGYTANRARESIRGLMEVAPNRATVLRPCMDCAEHLGREGYVQGPCPYCGLEQQQITVEELKIGETIVVKPGERIPMDGLVHSGLSAVNQAPITGESQPINKSEGDSVFAGSINGFGTLDIVITHLAADNTISRLIAMVEEAQEKRAPTQRFVDRFARYYTPAVVLLAASVAIIPPLLSDQPLLVPTDPSQGWLYRALALLVVACPCALVISTPVSIISAISNGARNGVIFKGGAFVEALGQIRTIAFDKTGTLTRGQPAVLQVRAAACTAEAEENCNECDDLLALASALEQRSEHPLAHAIVAEAQNHGLHHQYGAAEQVTALAGQGVRGKINGRQVIIGSHKYFDRAIPHDAYCAELNGVDDQGYTTILISEDDRYLGYLALADEIRTNSRATIAKLKELDIERLVMLTGDNEKTARFIAEQAGIKEIRANCLPQDKVNAVNELAAQPGGVIMVGDGINDTPALATATVGVAIGHTAQAMETADVTLMGNDIHQLPFAIQLSRAAMRTIRFNVIFSIGIKMLFLLLILLGRGTLWMAVFADMGASLLVTIYGMRLLRHPKPTDSKSHN
ncbi:MAG: cation-translocating P-type ATPase [Candidatus Promineifilaceae bacterium]|nr:cation-translocating P-type ATPase [Candidatus Promineifilaceae bacterium]